MQIFSENSRLGRPRLRLDPGDARIYAIGDIHGCLAELLELERMIERDAAAAQAEKWLITLGDAVDRGPESAAVLRHLREPPPAGWRRFTLAGNHDQLMLDFLRRPTLDHAWLVWGGLETLASFGMSKQQALGRGLRRAEWERLLERSIPRDVRHFMGELPVLLETPTHVFVHAGLDHTLTLDANPDDLLMWIRPEPADYASLGKVVVHGHTIQAMPVAEPWRIAIDTGAFATGVLTAAVIAPGEPVRFLSTGGL